MKIQLMFTICTSLLLFTACGRSQTSTTESSPTTTPKVEETVKSATDKASNTVQSALDQAKLATEQTSQKAQSTIDQAKSTANKASETVKEVMVLKEGLQRMSTEVSNTVTAVNSGDFTTAAQEFSKLQDNWTKIGGVVQTKSDKVYQQVDDQVNTIAPLFKEANPDRTKLLTELNVLGKTLTDSLHQNIVK
jgi:chaperonin cofactor prefoldin